jgi:hypothetical protein
VEKREFVNIEGLEMGVWQQAQCHQCQAGSRKSLMLQIRFLLGATRSAFGSPCRSQLPWSIFGNWVLHVIGWTGRLEPES